MMKSLCERPVETLAESLAGMSKDAVCIKHLLARVNGGQSSCPRSAPPCLPVCVCVCVCVWMCVYVEREREGERERRTLTHSHIHTARTHAHAPVPPRAPVTYGLQCGERGERVALNPNLQTLNPNPQTLNHNLQTLNPHAACRRERVRAQMSTTLNPEP